MYEHMTNEEKDVYVEQTDSELSLQYKTAKMSKELYNNNMVKNKTLKKYNIAFLTYEDRDIEYIKLHHENIDNYCNMWGYDYIHVNKNDTIISPYWYKVFLVYNILKLNKYDYVFWMDSDTIINDSNIDLSNIISNYNSDIFVASDNTKTDIGNAGLFIIKNSDIGIKFMEDWIDSYSVACDMGNKKLRGKWAMSCYEQGMMNKLIMDKYAKNTTFLKNDILNNIGKCSNDGFILHYYAGKNNLREKCFKNI
ncbi:putative glycosyltransferase [Bodo saltans virus]|uniref:Glycosyltransferase n=1 Tax=Bodo saltans virus TaxID=2024608 RepID=A0A2H4UTF5_9VIRU|nr:putative glycosyltransferase [Bodo saltans virus]ATZ80221.1 putative glycosyltransferase [Bodo saltans virus]